MIIYTENRSKENLRKCAKSYKDELTKKKTKYEELYIKMLKKHKIPFEFQKIIYYDNSFFIVDFYIPLLNSIVEIDGGYHFTDSQISKDRHRTFVLKQKGYNVIRLTNEEVEKLALKYKIIKK